MSSHIPYPQPPYIGDTAEERPLPSPYRAIFSVPGTRGFAAAGLIGRMPLSMLGIGIVTMMSQVTGRYRIAGALAAVLALSGAALGPQVSRLVDRYGQRRVLRPAAGDHGAGRRRTAGVCGPERLTGRSSPASRAPG